MRILLYPGQSSKYAEMISRAHSLAPECADVLARASAVLGRDLLQFYSASEELCLAQNRDVQVGVFLANHLHFTALMTYGGAGDRSLGLSLGEYNHLVHIGALSFEDALRLVDARGQLYDAGPLGMMVSVFPLPLDELMPVVEEARAQGVVEIGNFNSPTQHVLTGERAAVERAVEVLERDHFAQAIVIEERVPMHCSIFREVAERFRSCLEQADFRAPHTPYHPNVTGIPVVDPRRSDFVELLTEHVHRPVRWRESIDWLAGQYPQAVFVETGPRAVLYNMLGKSWIQHAKLKTDHPGEPLVGLRRTAESLRHAS